MPERYDLVTKRCRDPLLHSKAFQLTTARLVSGSTRGLMARLDRLMLLLEIEIEQGRAAKLALGSPL